MAEPARTRTFRLTFGLERLGLIALNYRLVSLVLIGLISVAAAFGVSRLKVDDSLSELFRTNTEEFRRYEIVDTRFPSSEYDVLAVVESADLLSSAGLQAFADALIELQLADGIAGVVSMMSARGNLDETGYAPPVVPDVLPEDPAEFQAMVQRLKSNEIVRGKFLSDDGRLAMIVLSLDRKLAREVGTDRLLDGISAAITSPLEAAGLTFKLTGAPVMQREIREAVERDRIVYNGLGLLLGLIVAYFFFRRLSLTFLAVLGPAVAILWTLGAIGGLDFRLNLFINVLTPLILVSGFSDSMHLVMAIRRDIMAGADRVVAARNAVIDVAPACLLTAMNAALALMSFAFAESALVRTFGQAAILAVTISYLAVAVVVPTVAAFVIRREPDTDPAVKTDPDESGAIGWVGHRAVEIVRAVAHRPVPVLAGSIALVMMTGLAYLSLEARYRLADQIPDRDQALAATARIDAKLTGANPVHVMVEWPKARELYDPSTLDVIGAVHVAMETVAGLGNVWSVDSLKRWLEASGKTGPGVLKSYVDVLPDHLVRRFVAVDEKSVLVTGRLPDIDASEILPVVARIEEALKPLRAAHPDMTISVTGLPAIAARNSATLIGELNVGLVGDMFIIFIFLGIALRSLLAGVASALPSLFPIFATGSLIWLLGGGLQFASIIAITVAFALAIDSTIHFLNRYHIEEDKLGPKGASVAEILESTALHIGPAVILTTIVLALGLGVTVLSDLPSLRLFGGLTAVCLFASLIGQLVILPAVIAVYRSYIPKRWSEAERAGAPPAQ